MGDFSRMLVSRLGALRARRAARIKAGRLRLAVMAAVMASSALVIGMHPSPALASGCTFSHGWSFWQDTSLPRYEIYVYIRHSSLYCPTRNVYNYKATNVNTGQYLVTVTDNDCDNLGITAYSHKAGGGYNYVSSSGCGSSNALNWPIPTVAYPWVWWVNVGGVNSPNYALPDAP